MGGLTSLLLLLCVGVTVSTVLDLQKRIIGGEKCPGNQRGYHVKFIREKDDLICGGSLLENNWVLTAAHCWEWGMRAVVGVHPGTKPAPVTVLITAPPVMYGDNNNRIHDIMLLKLPSLTNPPKITPVDLPDCAQKPKLKALVQVAGHGPTKNGKFADILQCANLATVKCPWLQTHEHVFCGSTAGVSTCGGDSGGGVEYNGMIYGVHKGSVDSTCPRISAFMDVCEYLTWIKDKTGIK